MTAGPGARTGGATTTPRPEASLLPGLLGLRRQGAPLRQSQRGRGPEPGLLRGRFAVGRGDAPGEVQPQPQASVLARGHRSLEALEDAIQRLVRDVDAVVPHRDAHPPALAGGLKLDGVTGPELERVGQQVHQRLLDAAAIPPSNEARRGPHPEFALRAHGLLGEGLDHVQQALDELRQAGQLWTGYDGVNLLPLDYDPNTVLLSFYRGGKLIRQVRLQELMQIRWSST